MGAGVRMSEEKVFLLHLLHVMQKLNCDFRVTRFILDTESHPSHQIDGGKEGVQNGKIQSTSLRLFIVYVKL